MSLLAGLALALLVMVITPIGLTAFAIYLRQREQPEEKGDGNLEHA